MLIFVITLLIYIVFSFIGEKYFCKGKIDANDWKVFNLSIYIEMVLTLIYLSVPVFEIYNLIRTTPIWYEWIIPMVFILVFLVKALLVFTSRNYYIKLKGKLLEYNDANGRGVITIEKCFFKLEESQVSTGKSWHLEVVGRIDDKDIVKVFDLKSMNLNGFKNSIEDELKK